MEQNEEIKKYEEGAKQVITDSMYRARLEMDLRNNVHEAKTIFGEERTAQIMAEALDATIRVKEEKSFEEIWNLNPTGCHCRKCGDPVLCEHGKDEKHIETLCQNEN